MINSTMTVREVAVALPQSTRLFEKLKIDYCCGGNRALTDACAAVGLAVDDVMTMLKTFSDNDVPASDTIDFQKLSLAQLIAHILDTHHDFTEQEMIRLESLVQKVVSAHSEHHPELQQVAVLFNHLCADLRPHMLKEEQILFPYILKLEQAVAEKWPAPFAPFGTVNNPVRMMMLEHDRAGEILRELRTVTADYAIPPDACMSYLTLYQALEDFEKDLHQHIHLENNLLFPRAIDLETAS